MKTAKIALSYLCIITYGLVYCFSASLQSDHEGEEERADIG